MPAAGIRANTTQWKIGVAALGPRCSAAAKMQLRRKMQEAYEDSQARVHVVTGRLKSSGRLVERDGGWSEPLEIDLVYGGEEFGVDYAGYEEVLHPFLEPTTAGSLSTFDSAGEVLEGPFD